MGLMINETMEISRERCHMERMFRTKGFFIWILEASSQFVRRFRFFVPVYNSLSVEKQEVVFSSGLTICGVFPLSKRCAIAD